MWRPPVAGCADAQVFALAPPVPAPAAPPAVLGMPTPTPHRQTSGALERTPFFFRFSFGLHPPDESAFVCPSDGQSSGQTSGRTKGLSSGQTPTGGTVTPPRGAPAHGGQGGRHGARAGEWDWSPRDGAPPTAPLGGVSNRRRAAATEDGAQARSPAGHRGRVEPRKSLRAVAARNSGRWRGVEGQTPSGPCDPCGRTVLLSHVTLFAF